MSTQEDKASTFIHTGLSKVTQTFAGFSLRWKIFVLVAILLGLSVLIIAPREASIVRDDKISFIKDLTSRLTRSTSKSFLNRINSLQDKLIIFTSYRESLAHTSARVEDQLSVLFSQEQEFLAIGLVNMDDKSQSAPTWMLRNPDGPATLWAPDAERVLLSQIPPASVAGKTRALWSAHGPNHENLIIFGLRVEIADPKAPTVTANKTWITGILPATIFDDLLTDFSTGVNKAYLLDEQGVAIATSDAAARWKSLKSNTLFNDALHKQRSAASAEYILDGKKVIGDYEAVSKTNLVTVVTTPEDKVLEVVQTISRSVHFIGLVFLLFSLALTVLFSNYFLAGPLNRLLGIVGQWGEGRFNIPLDSHGKDTDELGSLAAGFKSAARSLHLREEKFQSEQRELTLIEKMKAFAQFSAGVTKDIKNPLSGILGHIQLAAVKNQSEEVKKHLDIAEQEIRRCKSVLESLSRVSQTEKSIFKPVSLAEVVESALAQTDHNLSLARCKVFKDLRPCPLVKGDFNQLQSVIVGFLNNAAQAMEGSKEKNITVRVLKTGAGLAQVQVEDTGIGIALDGRAHIFEPFYTTKSAGRGMGLSLSVSLGILKEHGGDISFQSEKGAGTTFTLELPLPDIPLTREVPAKVSVKPIKNPEITPDEATRIEVRPTELPQEERTVIAEEQTTIQTGEKEKSLITEMPPIPEDDGYTFIPEGLPIASEILKAHVAEFTQHESVAISMVPDVPGLAGVEPVQLKTVNDFKVKIRRPRLRT